MSHVDDGRLHAYLDGALPGGLEERRHIEEHLRDCADCRALLKSARADRDGASDILTMLQPTTVEAPEFESLVAGRSGRGNDAATRGPQRRPATERWLASVAWAATIVIALGGGWIARGVLTPSPSADLAPTDLVARAERPSEVPAEPDNGALVEEARQAAEPPLALADADVPAAVTTPLLAGEVGRTDEFQEETQQSVGSDGDVVNPAAELAAPVVAASSAPLPAAPPQEAASNGLAERETVLSAGATPAAAEALQLSAQRATQERTGVVAAFEVAAAVTDDAWMPTNPAEAARQLGRPLLELADFPWERMEVTEVDGRALIRTVHPVDGFEVELIQGLSVPSDGVSTPARQATLDQAQLSGPTVSDERNGIVFTLRGLDTTAALEQLLPLLR